MPTDHTRLPRRSRRRRRTPSWSQPARIRAVVHRGAAIAAALLVAFVAAPWLAAASPATPTAAAHCEAPPRSHAELTALFATPIAATPTPGLVPAGAPADPETAAALSATVAGWLACQNAGEPLRAWSWFTDAYLRRLLDRQGGVGAVAYAAFATPEPAAPDDLAAIASIRDARLLPDGHAGATVTLTYPAVPMPKTFFFTFAQANGRWLIDDILGEISFSVP